MINDLKISKQKRNREFYMRINFIAQIRFEAQIVH